MRSDDIAFLDNPDRKTVNFSSSPRGTNIILLLSF